MADHEGQLALAKDRHHRVGDGADLQRGEVDGHELPPVRQLVGDDIVLADPERHQNSGDGIDPAAKLAIAQSGAAVVRQAVGDQGCALRRVGQVALEIIEHSAAAPETLAGHLVEAGSKKDGIEGHGRLRGMRQSGEF